MGRLLSFVLASSRQTAQSPTRQDDVASKTEVNAEQQTQRCPHWAQRMTRYEKILDYRRQQ